MDEKLLNILACPACKADVLVESEKIICTGCKKVYVIENGIPVLLVEEAEHNS